MARARATAIAHSHASHPHESGWQMAMPLAVLAVPSVLVGLLGMPWNSRFGTLLDPQEAAEVAEHFSWGEFLPLAGASVAISLVGITIAVLAYALHKLDLATAVAARFPRINAFLANKWYLDAINDKLFVQGSRKLAALGARGGFQGGRWRGEPHRPASPWAAAKASNTSKPAGPSSMP
jgi:NAD(P)H-quinone oxidoreductase subunit 5